MNQIHSSKYHINPDHQILTDLGIFYPLWFEITLAPASQVIKGAHPLKYKLPNIQLKYEMIRSVYISGKEFAYDLVTHDEVVSFDKGAATRLNIIVNPQMKSLKCLLLLFVETFAEGKRDSEKYTFPDLKKVSVAIKISPNMEYNSGIESKDMWGEAHRFFVKDKNKSEHRNMTQFYTDNKFGVLIALRSMLGRCELPHIHYHRLPI